MKSNRTTARIVGALFLTAMAAYGIGNGLITSVVQASNDLPGPMQVASMEAAGS